MRHLWFILLCTAAVAQEYGPFDLGTSAGSRTFEVTTSSGTLLVSAGSTGGGTGGRNYSYSEARNGSTITGWSNERVSFNGVTDTLLVASYYWWVSLSEDGSWGYYDRLDVYVHLAEPAPTNHPPTVAWTSAPSSANHGESYFVAAEAHDDDGNLTEVRIWKNGQPFAFAGGGNGRDHSSGNSTSDSGPQAVTFTAEALDAEGISSSTITLTVTIAPPPPTNFTLTTSAGPGGTVNPGGVFPSGTTVALNALPDATHIFSGWSGDVSGNANPTSIVVDRNLFVRANFTLRTFPLVVSATGNGIATGGGTYPYGTVVTITAQPDTMARFVGWSGDVSGSALTTTVLMVAARSAQAVFVAKEPQTLSFAPIPNRDVTAPAQVLTATASSGLPVSFAVLSGPALLNGNQLTLTDTGPVSIQASQAGDATYLPAPPVVRTFNATIAPRLRFAAPTRTRFDSRSTLQSSVFVLQ